MTDSMAVRVSRGGRAGALVIAALALGASSGCVSLYVDNGLRDVQPSEYQRPLVKLGHTHVISTHALRGSVWIPAQLEHTSCAFELPVADLLVDDREERRAAGGEFAAPLDEDARSGTREHMLGDRQLDAAHYPLLGLRCQQASVLEDGLLLQLLVSVRDHDAPLAVPVHWQRDGCTLQASGEFTFRQSDLGIEPYSLMLGVLRVDDEIRARFQLTLHCPPAAAGQGRSPGPFRSALALQ